MFIERKRPSEQLGKPKDGEINIASEREYSKSFLDNRKYKDGESFGEIIDRAKSALEFLEAQKEYEIVVVTHGMFLRVICAVVLLKDSVTPKTCFEFMVTLKTKNTGITVIEKGEDGKWQLITWNDHAHFAEY